MILFTKEVFLQVKSVTNMHVNVVPSAQYPGQPSSAPVWQVYIHGIIDVDPHTGMSDIQVNLNCDSKEDAYRMFGELARQIVDSGTVPELNSKLFDEVLKGDVK